MFSASTKTSTPSGGGADPQFNYVTMLLHGDGTNGAQNNTFLDSSSNTFIITRNGNATQGSFSPYGSNWSNYFDGTGDRLQGPTSNAAFQFGTGDFTVECWLYQTARNSYPSILEIGSHVVAGGILFYAGDNSNLVGAYDATAGFLGTATAPPLNTWGHIAFVRSGGTFKIYVNGVGNAGVALSTNLNNSSTVSISGIQSLASSYDVSGYMSNLRLVKGTAVYTSNFTPPTAPLSAISGTSFLICQGNRFVDNSGNNFPITISGTPSVQRFNPFGTSTAYSTAVIGGSGYFDGSGDYLSIPDNAAFTLGSGDWCSEGWVYATYYPTYARLWGQGVAGGPSNSSVDLFMLTGSATSAPVQLNVRTKVAGSGNDYLTSALPINQWYHIAVYRISGTIYIGINGVVSVVRTTAGSMDDSTANYCIGANSTGSGNEFWQGYITNQRLVVGNSVYTSSNFTPPTAPLTAVTGTQLLTNMTNGAIFDNAMMNNLETVGNAQISTSVVKYGTGSLAFDGTGDYLYSNPATTNLYAFGTGDFTIEFWVYINNTTGTQIIYDCRESGVSDISPTLYLASGAITFYSSGDDRIRGGSLAINNWYHVALCKSSGSTKLFLNGTQTGSTYTDTNNYINSVGRPTIGAMSFNLGTASLNGYIDDLRITKGYARYTANFTPPTAAFPNTGPY